MRKGEILIGIAEGPDQWGNQVVRFQDGGMGLLGRNVTKNLDSKKLYSFRVIALTKSRKPVVVPLKEVLIERIVAISYRGIEVYCPGEFMVNGEKWYYQDLPIGHALRNPSILEDAKSLARELLQKYWLDNPDIDLRQGSKVPGAEGIWVMGDSSGWDLTSYLGTSPKSSRSQVIVRIPISKLKSASMHKRGDLLVGFLGDKDRYKNQFIRFYGQKLERDGMLGREVKMNLRGDRFYEFKVVGHTRSDYPIVVPIKELDISYINVLTYKGKSARKLGWIRVQGEDYILNNHSAPAWLMKNYRFSPDKEEEEAKKILEQYVSDHPDIPLKEGHLIPDLNGRVVVEEKHMGWFLVVSLGKDPYESWSREVYYKFAEPEEEGAVKKVASRWVLGY